MHSSAKRPRFFSKRNTCCNCGDDAAAGQKYARNIHSVERPEKARLYTAISSRVGNAWTNGSLGPGTCQLLFSYIFVDDSCLIGFVCGSLYSHPSRSFKMRCSILAFASVALAARPFLNEPDTGLALHRHPTLGLFVLTSIASTMSLAPLPPALSHLWNRSSACPTSIGLPATR
jgi:hypothetical protein